MEGSCLGTRRWQNPEGEKGNEGLGRSVCADKRGKGQRGSQLSANQVLGKKPASAPEPRKKNSHSVTYHHIEEPKAQTKNVDNREKVWRWTPPDKANGGCEEEAGTACRG